MSQPQEYETVFSAPVDAGKSLNLVDCGCSVCPNWTYKIINYARPGVFALCLSISGFFHGVILNYFRSTSEIWGDHYNIDPSIVSWLIYVNEFLVGIFALFVPFLGNKTHRPKWIGCSVIFLALMAFIISIPEIYWPYDKEETKSEEDPTLCRLSRSGEKIINDPKKDFHYVQFVLIIIFQIIYAITSSSILSHGLSYLDDNVSEKNSPAFLGGALAGIELGKQIGTYLSWIPLSLNEVVQFNVFLSPVWICILILSFISGFTITLFPRLLPNLLMKEISASICDLASGNEPTVQVQSSTGYFLTIFRIIRRPTFLLVVFSSVLLQAALINFDIFEDFFHHSKYLHAYQQDTTGYNDPVMVQFTTNLLKQPFVALSLLATGVIISKLKPKARNLIIWNIVIISICTTTFGLTKLWPCEGKIVNDHDKEVSFLRCSLRCNCPSDETFRPVCINDKTYFSACRAGCQNFKKVGHLMTYSNCNCENGEAIEGPCEKDTCTALFNLSQANNILIAGFLASTVVINLVLVLRVVHNLDKASAIGVQQHINSIIVYIPIRLIYQKLLDISCMYKKGDTCQYYSKKLADYLAIATLIGFTMAVILNIALLFLVKNLDLYTKKTKEEDAYDSEDDAEEDTSPNNETSF